MNGAESLAYLLIIILMGIILGSDIWLATNVFQLTGLTWLAFIIIYFIFVFWLCKILVNIGD